MVLIAARLSIYKLVVVASLVREAWGCGPSGGLGRGPRTPRPSQKPFVLHQFEPVYAETHFRASGQLKGPVSQDDERFKKLVPVYDDYIVIQDKEGTGHDRMMTDRCVEKLKALAISVMNQWPGVKLRVVDGWIENVRPGYPENDSLHYEGRAVDITTSDRDRSKNGMLARLAVEAGFDWVYYEAKSHIHCSVKSESSQGARTGGCFPSSGVVTVEGGIKKTLSDLRVGESVLSYDKDSGRLVYSQVLMFLDRNEKAEKQFLKLKLSGGQELVVTPQHLVMRSRGNSTDGVEAVFAANLQPSDKLLVTEKNGTTVVRRTLLSSELVLSTGIIAPLTSAGTVIVDDVVASCYAVLENQFLAHLAFAPVRWYESMTKTLQSVGRYFYHSPNNSLVELTTPSEGVHWYPRTLYALFNHLIPDSLLYK